MNLSIIFIGFIVSIDALFVSIASSVQYKTLGLRQLMILPISFGFFQFVMPLIGYFISFEINNIFNIYRVLKFFAGLILLLIGLKMIFIDSNNANKYIDNFSTPTIWVESVATSIDALSIGFTIFDYNVINAFINSAVIGIITFIICSFGIILGNRIASKYNKNAIVLGGIILILIAFKIIIT